MCLFLFLTLNLINIGLNLIIGKLGNLQLLGIEQFEIVLSLTYGTIAFNYKYKLIWYTSDYYHGKYVDWEWMCVTN